MKLFICLRLKIKKEKAAPEIAPIAPFLRASETILARIWLFKVLKSSATDKVEDEDEDEDEDDCEPVISDDDNDIVE